MHWTSREYLYSTINEFHQTFPDFAFKSIIDFCEEQEINLILYDSTNEFYKKYSKDGFCFFDKGQYTIFYNKNMPAQRIKFTIAHELGHIYLNHHLLINRNMLMQSNNETVKTVWEWQADIFAHNILLPADFAYKIKNYKKKEIASKFILSNSMIEVRYAKLQEDLFYLKKYAN